MTETAAPETAPVPSVADLIELHSAYGQEIEVNDADGRIYTQDTCRCGMPLGMHLSLEAHRAQAVEEYVAHRLADSFRTVRGRLQLVADELALHEAPLHIQATLDQIIVEHSIELGLPDQELEDKTAALQAAVAAIGLPGGVSFFTEDGGANIIWQRPDRRVTVYIVRGGPYEVEIVPMGPVTSFRSDDTQATALEVKRLLAAGQDD